MREQRIIDPHKCHAWIYGENRQCRVRRPRGDSGRPEKPWYCQNHGWPKRTVLWLRYRWSRASRRTKVVLAPFLLLLFLGCKFGPDLYDFLLQKHTRRGTAAKLDRLLEHFPDKAVESYLDEEYPLGYILYKIQHDEIIPMIKRVSSRLSVSFNDPYIQKMSDGYWINLNAEFSAIKLRFNNTHVPVPHAKGIRSGRVWAGEYGLLSELVEQTESTSYVCLALSNDKRLFAPEFPQLELIPSGGLVVGECFLDQEYTALVLPGTLCNTGESHLKLSNTGVFATVRGKSIMFHHITTASVELTTPDGMRWSGYPGKSVFPQGMTLAPGERKDGYAVLATLDISLAELSQLLSSQGIKANLVSLDSNCRREVWSREMQLGPLRLQVGPMMVTPTR
jgi:hypothetical protein